MSRLIERQNDGSCVLVVAEAGSAWTAWSGVCLERPGDVAVIAQEPGEAPELFARRAAQRILRLIAGGFAPGTAVLATGSARDDATSRARVLIARALLRSLPDAERSELVLAAQDRFDAPLCHELFGLAQALLESMIGTRMVVRVQPPPAGALANASGALAMPSWGHELRAAS
jgi:hypothetical protein